jgi:hypothetical protein
MVDAEGVSHRHFRMHLLQPRAAVACRGREGVDPLLGILDVLIVWNLHTLPLSPACTLEYLLQWLLRSTLYEQSGLHETGKPTVIVAGWGPGMQLQRTGSRGRHVNKVTPQYAQPGRAFSGWLAALSQGTQESGSTGRGREA